MKRYLFFLCLFLTSAASGQNNVRCPKVMTVDRYYQAEHRYYAEATLGLAMPFMYRNGDGGTGEHFRFASRLGPVTGISYHYMLSDRLEAFAGIELANSKQGLKFGYADGGKIEERKYNGSLVLRLPLGLTWNQSRRWSFSLAPFVAYTSLWEQHYTGSYNIRGGNDIIFYTHDWDNLETFDQWFFGVHLSARAHVWKRLYGSLLYTVDFAPSASAAGEVRIGRTDNSESLYKGQISPWLMHFGIGLSYRLFDRTSRE